MKLTAQLWGNSLGLRIPAPVARDTNLTPGSTVDLQVENGVIVITPLRTAKYYDLKAMLSKIKPDNLPNSEIWGAPVGKEVW